MGECCQPPITLTAVLRIGHDVAVCPRLCDATGAFVAAQACAQVDAVSAPAPEVEHGELLYLTATRRCRGGCARAAASLEGLGSLQMWDGNRLADFCAKQQAISLLHAGGDRASPQVLLAIPDSNELRRDFSSAVQELAIASGWVLAQGQDKVCDRGGVHASRGLGGGRAAALGNAGGHRFLSWRGGSACVQCWRLARTKTSLRTIRNKRCRGCVADRVHASHRLQWTEGVWWCGLCGRFATTKPARLLERCPGVPLSGSARRYLSAFLAGGVVPGRGDLRDLAWHLGTEVGRAFCEVAVEAAFQRWFALGEGDGASLVVPRIPE